MQILRYLSGGQLFEIARTVFLLQSPHAPENTVLMSFKVGALIFLAVVSTLALDRQVDQLFLVGVDAAFCVYYTALGALNRGYKVTVVTDAVMSRCKMEGVLEKYRRKGIDIITSKEFPGKRKTIASI